MTQTVDAGEKMGVGTWVDLLSGASLFPPSFFAHRYAVAFILSRMGSLSAPMLLRSLRRWLYGTAQCLGFSCCAAPRCRARPPIRIRIFANPVFFSVLFTHTSMR
jgi:hypothetical protein